jgi:hypothetical protein
MQYLFHDIDSDASRVFAHQLREYVPGAATNREGAVFERREFAAFGFLDHAKFRIEHEMDFVKAQTSIC